MSFTGTTPQEVRILLHDLMKNVEQKSVYVGCSGNFTTDKLMASMGFDVHSNDVSLYSKLIADIILNEDTELEVINPDLKLIFDKWDDSRYKKLIQVMFAMRLSGFQERKNEYQQAMYNAFVSQSVDYYNNTIEKLQKGSLDFKIKSFSFCDFYEFLKDKKGKGVGVSFPPTYKGGYEKIFSYVEKSFNYERAKYNLFDPSKAGEVFEDLLSTDENIIYSDREWEHLSDLVIGKINLGPGKHPVFIYSSVDKHKNYYLQKKKETKPSNIQVLPIDYQFTRKTKITADICSVNDINYFKAFYMATKVNYTTGGDFGIVFFADGKAFGFTSFSKMLSTMELIFMQSDFVVNSNTPRLSKLLIMLMKSKEVRKLIARKMANYYEGVKTTVYSDKPISMKYRGVFELDRRDKGKLMYVGKFTDMGIKQIYQTWIDKQK